jgi:tripartite-type tricarboxylate transporter receptor subunit TctC
MRTTTRLSIARCIACTLIATLLAGPAFSQDFPSRPIRLVTPLPIGSATDAIARIISKAASESLGQQIIVDNKAGADGAIAAMEVARAAPDGYTLLMGTNSPLSAVPAMKKNPPYDALRDFTPITDVGRYSLFLVVNSELPVKNLNELIAYAKKNPGALSYASGNTAGFVAMAQIKSLAGLDMVHVPYKGEPAATSDLLANRVQLMFSNLTTAMPHIRSGKFRAITLTLPQRSPLFPDVATVAEQGLQGFSITSWNALFGPAKMPPEIVARLNSAFNQALARPDVIAALARQGIAVKGSTPEELARLVQVQLEAYTQVLRGAGVQLE